MQGLGQLARVVVAACALFASGAASAVNVCSIAGGWYGENLGQAQSTVLLTFTRDGRFVLAEHGSSVLDPSGQSGMELGTYTWNPASGALEIAIITDTNGQWGLSHSGSLGVSVAGNTLTVTDGGETAAVLTRVAPAASRIVGSWYIGGAGSSVEGAAMTFLPDGTYMFGGSGVAEPNGQPGMEKGTYTWNSATGAFSSVTLVNTDDQWGLSHAFPPFVTVSGNTMTFSDDGSVFERVAGCVDWDADGDGRADILWRNTSTGENYLYPMQGTAIRSNEGYVRTVADQAWRIAGRGDFDGDGKADILWRNSSSGENYVYLMDGTAIAGEGYLRTVADQNWRVAGVADFTGDGKSDILWRNESSGENYLYPMDGTAILGSEGYLRAVADPAWYVAGAGDFNGDGRADILWRNESSGENYAYLMDGTVIAGEGYLRTVADQSWEVVWTADFDGDGKADILWRNASSGENYLYPMDGLAILGSEGYVRTVADLAWEVASLGDFDGDGRSDILWRNDSSGENYVYLMNGAAIAGEGYIRAVADPAWRVVGPIDFGDEEASGGPMLQLKFNFAQGTFGGGEEGLLDYPSPIAYYFALFDAAPDATPPASVYFTGPEGSGLSDTESIAHFGDGGYSSPSRTQVPPGGTWTVNYEGQLLEFVLPDPDSTNRGIIVVPTVVLVDTNLTEVQWEYRDPFGAPVAPPQAFVEGVELRIDGVVTTQVERLYGLENIPFATTSHVLPSPITWSAVTQIQMEIRDNRGNSYTSYWNTATPPAPAISGVGPAGGPIGSEVTISGINFGCAGCVGGVNALRFTGPEGSGEDGISAVFAIDSEFQVRATVPAGALTGPIWLQSIGGTATSASDFIVTP